MAAPLPNGRSVGEIIDRVKGLSDRPQVSLRQIIEEFGEASFVPVLMVPALIVVSPLSGIFFLPTILGLTIALIAGQMLVGRRHLWLPGLLVDRSLSGARVGRASGFLERLGLWVDRNTRPRLGLLLRWPFGVLAPLGCFVSGLSMPFLELVPLSSSILGAAVVCFSVSILARDGVFLLLGLAFMGLAAMVPTLVIVTF